VVKVFTTYQNVDFYEPWKPGSTDTLEGCGSILPGGEILTNAHLVNKANYIEVQKFGETKKYVAKVDKEAYDMDLALLKVDDKDFAAGIVPVDFDDVPQEGDKVSLQGGDELSVKDDTVSGLDMVWCWEGNASVPAIILSSEIEAKINGCPVFNKNGKFIGIPLPAGTATRSREPSCRSTWFRGS
jgi:S1-C subfamily serine protease